MNTRSPIRYFVAAFVLTAVVVSWWLWWQRRRQPWSAAAPQPAPKPPAPAPAATRPTATAATAEAVATGSDPLEQISGVGPTYARRLRAAGVKTFAQLASRTPEELREIVGAAAWQADPASWIQQARQFSQG